MSKYYGQILAIIIFVVNKETFTKETFVSHFIDDTHSKRQLMTTRLAPKKILISGV